jgi:hypothetical protein
MRPCAVTTVCEERATAAHRAFPNLKQTTVIDVEVDALLDGLQVFARAAQVGAVGIALMLGR